MKDQIFKGDVVRFNDNASETFVSSHYIGKLGLVVEVFQFKSFGVVALNEVLENRYPWFVKREGIEKVPIETLDSKDKINIIKFKLKG